MFHFMGLIYDARAKHHIPLCIGLYYSFNISPDTSFEWVLSIWIRYGRWPTVVNQMMCGLDACLTVIVGQCALTRIKTPI